MSAYPTRPAELNFGGDSFNAPSLDPLRKGSTFIRDLEITGIDLTGHSARMSVKEDYNSNPVIFFSSLEVNPAQPRIDNDLGNNSLSLIAPASFTETIPLKKDKGCIPSRNKFRYDLEIVTPDNEVYAILEGEFWIVAELTTES